MNSRMNKNIIPLIVLLIILFIVILMNLVDYYWTLESNANRISLLSLIANGVFGVFITGLFSFLIWQSNKKSNDISKELKEINKKQFQTKRSEKAKLRLHKNIKVYKTLTELKNILERQNINNPDGKKLDDKLLELKKLIENENNIIILDSKLLDVVRDLEGKLKNLLYKYKSAYGFVFNGEEGKKFVDECHNIENYLDRKLDDIYGISES